MPRPRSERAVLVLGALALALALAGCGEKEEPSPGAPSTMWPPDAATGPAAPTHEDDATGSNPTGAERRAARRLATERAIERTVRAYIAGLDARDGKRVCAVLAPGVIEELRLPRNRGSCAASLDASIGYRDPRGLPQFAGIKLSGITAIDLGRRSASATTSIVTSFADRDEPSIEDDIVYLERSGRGWLIAKPSAALYRAIGAEPGPEVIAPPG